MEEYLNAILKIYDASHPHIHLIPVSSSKDPCRVDGFPLYEMPPEGWKEKKLKREEITEFLGTGFKHGCRIGFIPYASGLMVLDLDEFHSKGLNYFIDKWSPSVITQSRGMTKSRLARLHGYVVINQEILDLLQGRDILEIPDNEHRVRGEYRLKGMTILHHPEDQGLQDLFKETKERLEYESI